MNTRSPAIRTPEAELDFFKRQKSLLYLVVCLVSLLPFFGLGRTDLETDEGMWSLRARAAVEHGVWRDQTQYSIGGLYSSAYPPLYIWGQALSMKAFGVNPAAARLPSAVFGCATVIVIFYITRKIYGFRSAVLAAIAFGLSHAVIDLSQTAEMDIAYVFWVTLAIYLYMRYQRGSGRSLVVLPLAGVATGMAFLCKPLIGFYVPMVLAPYLLYVALFQRYGWKTVMIDLLILLLGAVAIASGWHLYMMGKYAGGSDGGGFWDALFHRNIVERAASPFEGHDSGWGGLYYVNVLLNLHPFTFCLGVIAMAETGRTLWHKMRPRRAGFHGKNGGSAERSMLSADDRMRLLVLVWLAVAFIVPTMFASKVSKYALLASVPFAILSGSAIDRVYRGATSHETNVSLFAWTATAIVYWQTHKAQDAVEAMVTSLVPWRWRELTAGELAVLVDGGATALLVVAGTGLGALLVALVAWSLRHRFLARHEAVGKMVVALVLIPMMIVATVRVFSGPRFDGSPDRIRPGATEVAFRNAEVAAAKLGVPPPILADHFIVLGHWRDNFQMSFYTGGANYGVDWRQEPVPDPSPEGAAVIVTKSDLPRLVRFENSDREWERRDVGHEQQPIKVLDPYKSVEELLIRVRDAAESLIVVVVLHDPVLVRDRDRTLDLMGRIKDSYGGEILFQDSEPGGFAILFFAADGR